MKFYEKYTGILRELRISYFINNVLNRHMLQHNKELYKKYGFNRSIFKSLSGADFKNSNHELPWLDQPDGHRQLGEHPRFKGFSPQTQAALHEWPHKGFVILENFFDVKKIDAANREIDQLLANKKIDFNYSATKLMNAWKESEGVNALYRDRQLLKIMGFLLGKKVIPFQTINFKHGSNQKAHSDFIHMATEPKGYLIAAWIALEDIDVESGPLFYYPASHKLPYVMSTDYPSGNNAFKLGPYTYKKYEDKIESQVKTLGLKPHLFTPKKGDVLIWHANLLHGGSPVMDKKLTRRSQVGHYFAEGVICYHEITQRPALIDPATLT